MKANELRSGNFIYNSGKGIARKPMIVTGNTISEIEKGKSNGQSPIPLTEEWVLKFGFKRVSMLSMLFYLKGFGWITILKNGENIFRVEGIELVIKYVHQLQNLYFALTGEELEIK